MKQKERTLSSVGVDAGTASESVAGAVVTGVRGTEMTEVIVGGPAAADAETWLRTVTVEAEELVMAVTSVTSVTWDKAVGKSGMIIEKLLTCFNLESF